MLQNISFDYYFSALVGSWNYGCILIDCSKITGAKYLVYFSKLRVPGTREPVDDKGPVLWQWGLWSFQGRGTKLGRFLHKNQHAQRNWTSGEPQ